MSKQLETKKIKVNNGQELIVKTREYKNLDGEWKLQEKYWTSPGGLGGRNTNEKHSKWGIIISDGKQKIDIYTDKVKDWENGGKGVLVNRLDEVNTRDELHQLFPEARFAYFAGDDKEHDKYGGRPLQSRLDFNTYKAIKDSDGEYDLVRYLVAENSWHLKQILNEYVQKNESKIYKSANPQFSGWVEIIDGQDGNMYLYVGEKKDSVGREIKIGITKNEFKNCKRNEDDTPEKALEDFWSLFTINRPRTPVETHEYYSETGGLEEEWKINWHHRGKLCRKYLESLQERMTKRMNYWKEKAQQKGNLGDEENGEFLLAHSHVAEIDYELTDMKKNRPNYYTACDKDCDICGVKLCCHFDGQACSQDKKWTRTDEEMLHFFGRISEPKVEQNKQISDSKKNQLLQYFLKNNIRSIKLEGENLVFTYQDKSQQIKTIEGEELQQIQKSLQNQPNRYLSLTQLQTNANHSNPNPNNNNLAIGLTVGGIILMGIIIFSTLIIRKKIKNFLKINID